MQDNCVYSKGFTIQTSCEINETSSDTTVSKYRTSQVRVPDVGCIKCGQRFSVCVKLEAIFFLTSRSGWENSNDVKEDLMSYCCAPKV